MVLCVAAVLGRYQRGVFAVTIGVVEAVAVVVHVAKCLAVVAVPPSVCMHAVKWHRMVFMVQIVLQVTIGVVEVVAVVVHVAKCLAVVAVPPSVRMHRVDLVETAGV